MNLCRRKLQSVIFEIEKSISVDSPWEFLISPFSTLFFLFFDISNELEEDEWKLRLEIQSTVIFIPSSHAVFIRFCKIQGKISRRGSRIRHSKFAYRFDGYEKISQFYWSECNFLRYFFFVFIARVEMKLHGDREGFFFVMEILKWIFGMKEIFEIFRSF